MTPNLFVTFHAPGAPAIDSLFSGVQQHAELAVGGCSDLAARLADGLTCRLLAVIDAFDDRTDGLIAQALVADSSLLADVTAVRTDLSKIRRSVTPQREALDLLRTSDSRLITDSAQRRFSDVFDVASRAAAGLDAARTALAETLDAYRGAEARQATEVTKVLTVYAAVVLPLSLIAGFFGMNHSNIPTLQSRWGWVVVAGIMILVAAVSIGVFVSEGWVRRPSGARRRHPRPRFVGGSAHAGPGCGRRVRDLVDAVAHGDRANPVVRRIRRRRPDVNLPGVRSPDPGGGRSRLGALR